MRRRTAAFIVLLAFALPEARPQSNSKPAAPMNTPAGVPLYRVLFERHEAVSDISSSPVIQLPLQCTGDGTMFVSFVASVPAGIGIVPPPEPPTVRLVSVSTSGEGQTFELDKIPELYISSQIDRFAADSQVVFLVNASKRYEAGKRTFKMTDGSQHEYSVNAAEQHRFILTFKRDGTYQRAVQIEDPFRIQQLGVFPSGTLLAFGHDQNDDSPKLAILKEDGTLLKPLQAARGDVPESIAGKDTTHPNVIVPAQFVPDGHSILIVQGESGFPLLEVSEGGAIKAIRTKLPKDMQIKSLIPSDRNLYAIVGPSGERDSSKASIYELSRNGGTILRRFELPDNMRAHNIACVHDEKFLSLDYRDGKIVPLVGSAEPAVNSGERQPPPTR